MMHEICTNESCLLSGIPLPIANSSPNSLAPSVFIVSKPGSSKPLIIQRISVMPENAPALLDRRVTDTAAHASTLWIGSKCGR
jgi:hypothetical protein